MSVEAAQVIETGHLEVVASVLEDRGIRIEDRTEIAISVILALRESGWSVVKLSREGWLGPTGHVFHHDDGPNQRTPVYRVIDGVVTE